MTYFIKMIQFGLITLLVFLGVKAFYGAVASKFDRIHIPMEKTIRSAEQKAETVRPFSAYQTIVRRNLFNTREKDSIQSKPDSVASLKPTQLKLRLWGTVIEDAGGVYAVIEDTKKREQNLYRIGDQVQHAEIVDILREKVVFRVEDEEEILEMADGSTANVQRIPASPTQRISKTHELALNREEVDAAVEDITELMKQVKIRPHPNGLSLSGIAKKSIFSKMGLKNGDVIVGVDGRDIQTVDDALGLYDSLRDSANISVEIKRRGRYERIEYTVE